MIAINKSPRVRPIGLGGIPRQIIAKAILSFLKVDVQDATGTLELYFAQQISGIEAAIHSVQNLFEKEETKAVSLVDASNAVKSLDRLVALQNIRRLCAPRAKILIKCYRDLTDLFVGGDVLRSREGSTQRDPLAKPMYAIATGYLIRNLDHNMNEIWYADDTSGVGTLSQSHNWWNQTRQQ